MRHGTPARCRARPSVSPPIPPPMMRTSMVALPRELRRRDYDVNDRPATEAGFNLASRTRITGARGTRPRFNPSGGDPMRTVAVAVAATLLVAAPIAVAQSWKPPAESQRCPSKWGAGDERGSGNHMKAESVLKATRLIRTGEVIELGHVLNANMPFFGTRRFDVHTKRTFMNPQSNRRGSNEEVLISEIGQVGTQLDGFTHQTIGDSLYNCFKVSEISTRNGFSKLGIEKVGTLMTRGVLIDVAGLKGVDMLGDTYEVTVTDLEQALQKQNQKLQPGDAVIIHTGWGKLWGKDNARYMKSSPGIGVKA